MQASVEDRVKGRTLETRSFRIHHVAIFFLILIF